MLSVCSGIETACNRQVTLASETEHSDVVATLGIRVSLRITFSIGFRQMCLVLTAPEPGAMTVASLLVIPNSDDIKVS